MSGIVVPSDRPQTLTGKVALVTGSSRGIGREIALELAARGADIVVNYAYSEGPAQEVAKAIQATGRKAIAIKANVSVVKEIQSMFEQIIKAFGKIDIVMSNSGVEHFGKFEDVTEEDFDRVFNINVRGQYFVSQQAFKYISTGGRLILIGSVCGQMKGMANHAVYPASKAAIEALARQLSADFGPKQVTVNTVAPGGIKTDMFAEVAKNYIPGAQDFTPAQVEQALASISPINRVGMPEDIARVVAFLASEDGKWVTGQTITIDGGAHM